MNEIQMQVTCTVDPTPSEDHLDAVLDAFYDIDEITDQSVEYSRDRNELIFDMIFEAGDQLDAVYRGYGYVRSAIHCAGGQTPGWDESIRAIAHQVSESAPRTLHDSAPRQMIPA